GEGVQHAGHREQGEHPAGRRGGHAVGARGRDDLRAVPAAVQQADHRRGRAQPLERDRAPPVDAELERVLIPPHRQQSRLQSWSHASTCCHEGVTFCGGRQSLAVRCPGCRKIADAYPPIWTLLANAHAWPGPAAGPGRRVWPRARSSLCLECSVRLPGQERTRSPSATWKISPSWKTGPREQGSRYHKGETTTLSRPIKPA